MRTHALAPSAQHSTATQIEVGARHTKAKAHIRGIAISWQLHTNLFTTYAW